MHQLAIQNRDNLHTALTPRSPGPFHLPAAPISPFPQKKSACACGGSCPACQAKSALNVSQPNDPAEIEADAIADRVMRMQVSENGRNERAAKPTTPQFRTQSAVQRKSDAFEEEHESVGDVVRKSEAFASAAPQPPPADTPLSIKNVIGSGGQPLDTATRNFFEPRFGEDLSHVRIHTDEAAARSANEINSKAFSIGRNIVFSRGEYRPESESGRHLLAHELTHTIQQGKERDASPSVSNVSSNIRSYGIGLSRAPDPDEERRKAVEEAKALVASIGNTDEDDDEPMPDVPMDLSKKGRVIKPAVKKARPPDETPSRFLPGGFTDKEIDRMILESQDDEEKALLSMSVSESYDAMVKRLGKGKEIAQIDDILNDNRDPKYLTKKEYEVEFRRRVNAEREKCDDDYFWPKYERQCRREVDEKYGGEGFIAWREERARRAAYEIGIAKDKIDNVRHSGFFGTVGRGAGYIVARIAGLEHDQAMEWSETGSLIGGVGDALTPVAAVVKARASSKSYNAGGGLVVSKNVPVTQTYRPSQASDPTSAPKPTATPADIANRPNVPAQVSNNPVAPTSGQQLLSPVSSTENPRIIKQEAVVQRRSNAVRSATEKYNQALAGVDAAQLVVASAKQNAETARVQAQNARIVSDRASAAAQGSKRNTAESKEATAKRNEATKADNAVSRADQALNRANAELTRARGKAGTAAQQAKDARDALKTSQKYLERLRSNPDPKPKILAVVQDPRTWKGPSGGNVVDHGYEGRRRDDPPFGMRSGRWAHTDANYQRMLEGRPPIGEDGGPINLHHRTRGPMSRLDEYTETQHRELKLHEPGRDSQVNRAEFDNQRERYWVQRARDLLTNR